MGVVPSLVSPLAGLGVMMSPEGAQVPCSFPGSSIWIFDQQKPGPFWWGLASALLISEQLSTCAPNGMGCIGRLSDSSGDTLGLRWGSVTEDWFVDAVEQVAAAGRVACEALEAAVQRLDEGRRARLAGKSVLEVVDTLIGGGGREVRFASAEAFRDYERAVAAMRAGVVRSLVDDHGLSLTKVARRLNISRQAAARLYRAEPEPPIDPTHKL
jgi:hypothetical protein